MSAAILVEVLALGVPRWRPLRIGGPNGRGRLLRATGQVALGLALVQALGLGIYLQRVGLLEGDPAFARPVVILTLVTGTFALAALAQLLDRTGLGGGFSVLLTALALPSLGPLAVETWRVVTNPSGARSDSAAVVGGALVACAVSVLVLIWRPLDG